MQLSTALCLNELAKEINENARKKGFWDSEKEIIQGLGFEYDTVEYQQKLIKRIIQLHDIEKIALEHSELSERLEALRKNSYCLDEHCPEFTNIEIECADLIIRCLDFCGQRNLRIGEALLAKHEYNLTRPYKHGKNF